MGRSVYNGDKLGMGICWQSQRLLILTTVVGIIPSQHLFLWLRLFHSTSCSEKWLVSFVRRCSIPFSNGIDVQSGLLKRLPR